MATLIKKISVATVIGNSKIVRDSADGAIMRVYGVVRGIQKGVKLDQDTQGNPISRPWTALTGSFQAVNIATGEIFASAKVFLPDVAGELVINAFEQAQEGDNPGNPGASIKFAFDIKKITSEKSVTGYEYAAVSLIEAAASDPLSEMATTLPAPATLAQIEAPKK